MTDPDELTHSEHWPADGLMATRVVGRTDHARRWNDDIATEIAAAQALLAARPLTITHTAPPNKYERYWINDEPVSPDAAWFLFQDGRPTKRLRDRLTRAVARLKRLS